MAIFGNLRDVKETFFKDKLEYVFKYLEDCLIEGSSSYERINNLAIGSFEKQLILGDIFALEQVFLTKERRNCFFESHRKFIDFQLVLSGTEQMELSDPSKMIVDKAYDVTKDLITYKFNNDASKLVMKKGDLAIYFPSDVHLGLGIHNKKSLVTKTVVKLPIELWNI